MTNPYSPCEIPTNETFAEEVALPRYGHLRQLGACLSLIVCVASSVALAIWLVYCLSAYPKFNLKPLLWAGAGSTSLSLLFSIAYNAYATRAWRTKNPAFLAILNVCSIALVWSTKRTVTETLQIVEMLP